MSEEEKKAIEMLDKFITEHKLYNIKQSDGLEDNIKIVLNLIEELNGKVQEQRNLLKYKTDKIQKQEKVIDEMAKDLNAQTLKKEMWCPLANKNLELYGKLACSADMTCLKCLKKYFYRKVEK